MDGRVIRLIYERVEVGRGGGLEGGWFLFRIFKSLGIGGSGVFVGRWLDGKFFWEA